MPIIITIIVIVVILGAFAVYGIYSSYRVKIVSGKEGMIGETGTVVEDFVKGEGQIRVAGEIWAAKSPDVLKKGDSVVVDQIHKLLLQVRRA